MVAVGALARFEAKPGNEAAVERFFQEGLSIVQQLPASTIWFAFRLESTTFGAFAAFANEEERQALLSVDGPLNEQAAFQSELVPGYITGRDSLPEEKEEKKHVSQI